MPGERNNLKHASPWNPASLLRSQRFLEAVIVLTIILLMPWLFFGAETIVHSPSQAAPLSAPYRLSELDAPYFVPPLAKPIFNARSKEAGEIAEIVQHPPLAALDGPVAIHLLRLYHGSSISRVDISSGDDDMKVLMGWNIPGHTLPQSAIVRTLWGIRYRPVTSNRFGENHRDVFLATYAEAGVPLSTTLHPDTQGPARLSDLLGDSIANFHLDQQVIDWTAIAYALDLPAKAAWDNRDGHQFARDDLASELLRRNPMDSPCGGAHLMTAMTYLVRVDEKYPSLSPQIRHALISRLRQCVAQCSKVQCADGSWTAEWPIENLPPVDSSPDNEDRLLITGHLVEWMVRLPSDLQPDRRIYKVAARWLIARLLKLRHEPEFEDRAWVCPWTHSTCGLKALCASESGVQNGPAQR